MMHEYRPMMHHQSSSWMERPNESTRCCGGGKVCLTQKKYWMPGAFEGGMRIPPENAQASIISRISRSGHGRTLASLRQVLRMTHFESNF